MSQKFFSDITLSTLSSGILKVDADGKVVKAVAGTDYIDTATSGSLDALSDVAVASPTADQILVYGQPLGGDPGVNIWYNKTPSFLTGASSISALGDVTIGTTSIGQLLSWNGNAWVNWSPNFLTSYTETDPIYTASSWYTTTNNSSNWDTAYGWGNHAGLYSLTSHTHNVFTQSTSESVGGEEIIIPGSNGFVPASGFNDGSKFLRGDGTWQTVTTDLTGYATETWVGQQGYLTSYAETDPVFVQSAAYNVRAEDITAWDEAYEWGDHNGLYAAASHNHDDRYYTETEVNTLLGGYLPTTGGALTGDLLIRQADSTAPGYLLVLHNSSNGNGASIRFTDTQTQDSQSGTITFYHTDVLSYGSGATLILGSSEAATTILADGKLMYAGGIWSKPTTGTGAGTRKDQNWDTAYSWGDHDGLYALAAHSHSYLPLSGGTVTGLLTITGSNGVSRLRIEGQTPTIDLYDSDSGADRFYIHVNANNFYILTDRDGAGTYGDWESPHPLLLEADTNKAYIFGSQVKSAAFSDAADFATSNHSHLNADSSTDGFLSAGDYDKFSTAFNWGDHSGLYLTAEADTLQSVTTRGSSTTTGATFGGNVGIGTTAPAGKLQVNTSSAGANVLQLGVASQEQFVFETGISGVTNGALVIKDSTTPYTYLTLRSGNVGIGTTSPVQKLQVDGSVYSNGGEFFVNTNSGITAVGNLIFKGHNGTSYFEGMRLSSSGNVGIGTTSPTEKLDVNGNVRVNGTLEATEKSFNIEHPTKPGKRLIYGVLEGPEHAVYVRGRATDGVIELPEEWTGLVDESTITVQLTPIGRSCAWVEDVKDNKVYYGIDHGYDCFYFVQATRKDVPNLITERDA